MADNGNTHVVDMPPSLGPISGLNVTQSQDVEDDQSVSSSNETELFDKSPAQRSHKSGWSLGISTTWPRYGSSESAASTAISSICSSTTVDETISHSQPILSPSRKRMADGRVKMESPTIDHNLVSGIIVAHSTSHTVDGSDGSVPAIKKKRGRPPKIRHSTDVTPQVSAMDASKPVASPSKSSRAPKSRPQVRPRSSIPSRLPADVFASQCLEAAHASRLDPYSLHVGEHHLLGDLLMSKEITIYLNIRNAILRLWIRNPSCNITLDEALGCARETRFFGLAEVAFRWLVRRGYINFGCVHRTQTHVSPKKANKDLRQRTVVVIGAGVAGLTTARQLENLFAHEASKWADMGESAPRVVVLEGRKRIGGRVYSKPFRSQVTGSLPDNLRNTAEMGAMIVTGFEHGNPLDVVIRGQLGLRYHLMRDALTIYDCDGRAVNEERDMLNTELYTDISDRAGQFRAVAEKQNTHRGDEELINRARDPPPDGFAPFQLEPLPAAHIKSYTPAARRGRRRNAPPGTEKLTGRSQVIEESGAAMHSASRAAREMGWIVKDGIAKKQNISLQQIATARDSQQTLGPVMDEAILQYQNIVDIKPVDMRLLNWHHANLEYANAAPVSHLSLSGHDQDTGNEFEGAHSEIIGGYSQLPRGLMNFPTSLDVRFDQIVDSVHYDDGDESHSRFATKVVCTNGEVIHADEVVLTVPLGVLKANAIDFDPPLPPWKMGAIHRMGFGLLNKIILLYDKPFWDEDRDMFGLLNESEIASSLNPRDYERNRGRFYLIWNCSKTSGRPMLIALMAGHAAHDAEVTDTNTLLGEVTTRLRSVFKNITVPTPLEVIVTRWKRDPFTRGTYSFVGPDTHANDYDEMARPVGNVHFAGEATCGTHPATVHGAFLSGLRAAAEVLDDMAGLISLPNPLVEPLVIKQDSLSQSMAIHSADHTVYPSLNTNPHHTSSTEHVIKHEEEPIIYPLKPVITAPSKSVCAGDASFWVSPTFTATPAQTQETAIMNAIFTRLGDRPMKPNRPGVNPFLLFMKDKWDECRLWCKENAFSEGRDVVRQTLGKWWKEADEESKAPFRAQSLAAQRMADTARVEWDVAVAKWDEEAARIRREWKAESREDETGGESVERTNGVEGNGVSRRKTNVSNCVVLDHT